MSVRNLFFPLLLACAATGLSACDLLDLGGSENKDEAGNEAATENRSGRPDARQQQACASNATYDRLKELVFDEAARIRGQDTAALDQLADASIVRMERPLVRSRDEDLNITLCEGHFILELPPGAERAFAGQRRLTADIQYSAQAAADGSGMVYEMQGAQPIINRLATVGTRMAERRPLPTPTPAPQPLPQAEPEPQPEPRREPQARAEPAPAPRPEPRPEPRPQAKAEPQPAPRAAARPSFNCAQGRSRSERMVCSSPGLAALDRQMSSQFYSALANADPSARAELRRSRDRFLAFRERCGSEACIAQAYRDRMDEISDIARGR